MSAKEQRRALRAKRDLLGPNYKKQSLKRGRSTTKKLNAARPSTNDGRTIIDPRSHFEDDPPVNTGRRRARSASRLREICEKADGLDKRRKIEEVSEETLAEIDAARAKKFRKAPRARKINRPSIFLARPRAPDRVLSDNGVPDCDVPRRLEEKDMEGYPTVVYHEDMWMELRCSACDGNAIKPMTGMPNEEADWVKGVAGFHRHLHNAHGSDIHKSQVASACKVREFTAEEVRKMRVRAADAPKIDQKWCLESKR
ncbi:hypothetical protein BU16DRAFT_544858 [Lophium mytilinum]|uniref:Uncharacterized protein n=1 Tax=Lophium mytilinum TaxID=390894 RepID=A0A6A6QB33_9PEZI|nr:hypothetical protein BU16DRAFT_544858 [Lophium mytilinum]